MLFKRVLLAFMLSTFFAAAINANENGICGGTRDKTALYCAGLIGGLFLHVGLSYMSVHVTAEVDDELSGEYAANYVPAFLISGLFSGTAGALALWADGFRQPNWGRFAWVYPTSLIIGGITGYYLTRRLKPLSIGLLINSEATERERNRKQTRVALLLQQRF